MKFFLLGTIYKKFLRPLFFQQRPETSHEWTLKFGNLLGKYKTTKYFTRVLFNYQHPKLEQEFLGLRFKNPVGLASGFDKDAEFVDILPSLGFGFTEVGSVTHQAYGGNPGRWLHRLPQSRALVVNYGLKSEGVDNIIEKLKGRRNKNFPIGVSIAKTNSRGKLTTKAGIEDYYQCLKALVENKIGDFYVINISCPNSFGGEPFTSPKRLSLLLEKLSTLKARKPVFLKMPTDLSWIQFEKLLLVAMEQEIKGVVIGNLSKKRDPKYIKDKIPKGIKGSISGKPCFEITNKFISKTYQKYGDKLLIIGVGGIFSAEDAYEKVKRGASLVQLITGMIYEGPQLTGEINAGLIKLLEKDGFKNINQAIGEGST